MIAVRGELRPRSEETYNPRLATGTCELCAHGMEVLSEAQPLPFSLEDAAGVREEVRLRYRFLDLRRPGLLENLRFRARVARLVSDFLESEGFLAVETPMLTKSTPEGARDYLVPSRVHQGEFYALPQSPQIFKQLLMVGGVDKYYQIARCFRDEDLRADRQPEFTQIDLEMSFVDEEDVMTVNEGFMAHVFKEVLGVEIPTPFLRMPYDEAMERFGSDKPDTRFGMELCNLSDLLAGCEFKVFKGALEAGGSVRALNVKGAADRLSRKEIDKLVDFVKAYRAGGLAYTRLTHDAETSSYEKFLTDAEKEAIRGRLGAEKGDVLLIVADGNNQTVFDSLGALRVELANRLGLIPEGKFNFLWVTEFPLFEYSEEEGRYVAKHHPFTHPAFEDIDKLESDPGACHARAYDMVLNGCEVGGGSIRINTPELQERMFEALGFSEESARAKFGYLIDAFKYGAPPHGGMAYGLDRLVMLMLGKPSIRDVMAFPKVQNASELMTQCPAEVDEKSLRELSIAVTAREEAE